MKTKNIFLIAFLAMAVISCKQLVQIDLPEDATNIVIEGQISNQLKPWSVTITKSQAFNDQDSASAVSDAVVIISDDAGNVDTLVYGTNGKYRTVSSRQCVPGRIYTLEVFYDNQYYAASELCRFQHPIDTFLAYFIPENNGFIEKGWYAFEVANEWEEAGDYYQWKIYRNDTLLDGFGYLLDEDQYREQGFFNIFVDPNDPLASISQGRLPRPFPFRFEPPDAVYLEQFCINKKYYDFLIELQTQQGRAGTPFDPPPANPISNISNGAYGYFSVVNVVTASTIIVE